MVGAPPLLPRVPVLGGATPTPSGPACVVVSWAPTSSTAARRGTPLLIPTHCYCSWRPWLPGPQLDLQATWKWAGCIMPGRHRQKFSQMHLLLPIAFSIDESQSSYISHKSQISFFGKKHRFITGCYHLRTQPVVTNCGKSITVVSESCKVPTTRYEIMGLFTRITNAWNEYPNTNLQVAIYEVVMNCLYPFSLQLLCRSGSSHEPRSRGDRDILVL